MYGNSTCHYKEEDHDRQGSSVIENGFSVTGWGITRIPAEWAPRDWLCNCWSSHIESGRDKGGYRADPVNALHYPGGLH